MEERKGLQDSTCGDVHLFVDVLVFGQLSAVAEISKTPLDSLGNCVNNVFTKTV